MTTSDTSGTGGQQYNLKWTNHTNNILEMFTEQLLKECLVDVTLSCEGQFVKAHKMVLSACSPYFQELFRVHSVDHPLIIMNGVRFSTMKKMIDFMYQGEIKVGDADLDHLLTIAENLQVKGLCKIRREKGATENSPFASDILKMQNSSVPSSTSPKAVPVAKGRKRRKQSHSPVSSSSQTTASQVNGESSTSNVNAPAARVPEKIPHIAEATKEEVDKSIKKLDPKLSKLLEPTKQVTPTTATSSDDKTGDKPGPKIPRPPNAFMIFANEWRKKLAVEHLGESNKEISVRLGNMWKAFPTTTKDWYYQAARKADEDHKVKYPGYYYSPKEARLRKVMRGNNSHTPAKTIDTMALVKTVMPDSKSDNSSNEDVQLSNEIKEEPNDFELFDEDNHDSSSSSAENVSSVVVQKD